MNTTVNEKKIKDLCVSIYPLQMKVPLPVPQEDDQYYEYLKSNRLVHLTNTYKKEYETYLSNCINELNKVKMILKDNPFIVIKTFSSYPHTTSDIDVVVKTDKITHEAKQKLIQYEPLPIMIDINSTITWTYTREISDTFIWNNTKEMQLDDLSILVPNDTLDTLIRIGHIPFELAELRLGELMHIFNTSKHIDWQVMRDEAKRMKWPQTFQRMEYLLNGVHFQLYGQYLSDAKIKNHINNLNFPYRLSYVELFRAFMEKRAWKKLKGAKYVIRDRSPLWIKKIFS